MRCISCGGNTAVVDKRTSDDNVTRRRRKCLKCGDRFSTREVLADGRVAQVKVIIDKPIRPKVPKVKPKKPLSPEKQRLIELFTKKVKP